MQHIDNNNFIIEHATNTTKPAPSKPAQSKPAPSRPTGLILPQPQPGAKAPPSGSKALPSGLKAPPSPKPAHECVVGTSKNNSSNVTIGDKCVCSNPDFKYYSKGTSGKSDFQQWCYIK